MKSAVNGLLRDAHIVSLFSSAQGDNGCEKEVIIDFCRRGTVAEHSGEPPTLIRNFADELDRVPDSV